MDVTGLLAVRDEMTGFKKFLDHEGLQYPLFINIYSNENKITFDITPIVRKTYKWVYDRLIDELEKTTDNSIPFIHIGTEMYNEYLENEFSLNRVTVMALYGDPPMKYSKDITDWLFVVFERIGKYLKDELHNTHRDLFNSIKYASNSLHTLKVF